MKNKESDMWKMYRFAEKAEEVNWDFRYRPNLSFMRNLIPYMLDHAEESIKKVTFKERDLKAVIGLSGGLDSCVSAWLVANAMSRGIKRKSSDNGRLVLMTFNGMSQEDLEYGRRFAKDVERNFKDIDIQYAERDIRPLMCSLHDFTDDIIYTTRGTKIYPGELATRLIDLLTLEYADKTGHCGVDSTNGSEIVLGEIVIGAGLEYSPISDLYKSQVFDLGEALKSPQYILDRNPINSTFGIDKVKSYFGEIPQGLTVRDVYAVLDLVLFYIFDKKMKPVEIAKKAGHSLRFVERVYQRVKNQDHRRKRPYFALNDRRINLPRIVQDKPNKEFKEYLDSCFLY